MKRTERKVVSHSGEMDRGVEETSSEADVLALHQVELLHALLLPEQKQQHEEEVGVGPQKKCEQNISSGKSGESALSLSTGEERAPVLEDVVVPQASGGGRATSIHVSQSQHREMTPKIILRSKDCDKDEDEVSHVTIILAVPLSTRVTMVVKKEFAPLGEVKVPPPSVDVSTSGGRLNNCCDDPTGVVKRGTDIMMDKTMKLTSSDSENDQREAKVLDTLKLTVKTVENEYCVVSHHGEKMMDELSQSQHREMTHKIISRSKNGGKDEDENEVSHVKMMRLTKLSSDYEKDKKNFEIFKSMVKTVENECCVVSDHGEKMKTELSQSQHRDMTHKILRSKDDDGEDVTCSSRLFHIKKCMNMCDQTKKSTILMVLLLIAVTCFAALNCVLPKSRAAGMWKWNQHETNHSSLNLTRTDIDNIDIDIIMEVKNNLNDKTNDNGAWVHANGSALILGDDVSNASLEYTSSKEAMVHHHETYIISNFISVSRVPVTTPR